MREERMTPRFHGKTKHKRQPTKRHLQDKLKALKIELQFWARHMSEAYSPFLRDLSDKRMKQINKRISAIKEQLP